MEDEVNIEFNCTQGKVNIDINNHIQENKNTQFNNQIEFNSTTQKLNIEFDNQIQKNKNRVQ